MNAGRTIQVHDNGNPECTTHRVVEADGTTGPWLPGAPSGDARSIVARATAEYLRDYTEGSHADVLSFGYVPDTDSYYADVQFGPRVHYLPEHFFGFPSVDGLVERILARLDETGPHGEGRGKP